VDTKKYINTLLIIFTSWLATTLIIDFMIIPGAFRLLQDIEKAGQLGLYIFSHYNKIELIMGVICLIASWKIFKYGRARLLPILAIMITLISLSYLFILTPQISMLREKHVELLHAHQVLSQEIKAQLMWYHRIYVGLDTFKILLLGCAMAFCLLFRPKIRNIFGKSQL